MPRSARRDTAAMRRKAAIARRAEMQFAVALRKVAKQIDILTRKTFKGKRPLSSSQELKALLTKYGQTLRPWALATARRMVVDVERRDEKFWKDQSALISKGLKAELRASPVGIAVRERTAEAAGYITSLPLEAALRVEKLSVQYMTQGIRANKLVKDIMRTGEVTKARANTIARTETSRTAGILQQVRAEAVGSDGYIWRTAGDIEVRELHADLEGKFFRWGNPPVIGTRGERGHPGGIYNCFTPETLVAPIDGHLSTFRANYSGRIIILVAGEAELRVTPNHPILTTCGWLAAEEIKEGDDLVNVPFEGFDRIKLDVDNGLIPFGKVFEAFDSSRKSSVGPINGFYGDIVNQKIEVVVPDLYLPKHYKPGILQGITEEMVTGSNCGIFDLAVSGGLLKIIEAHFAGISYNGFSLGFGSELEPEFVGVTKRSLNPSCSNYAGDSHVRAAVAQSEFRDSSKIVSNDSFFREIGSLISPSDIRKADLPLLRGEISNVALQRATSSGALSTVRVTGRFVDNFTGHVFTSETADGYYRVSKEGILSKNCRCWAEIVLPGERRPSRERFVAEEVSRPNVSLAPARNRRSR